MIFNGFFRFTITETVTFDFAGVAFIRAAAGAADFSLPGRMTRGCSETFGSLEETDLERVDFAMIDHFLRLASRFEKICQITLNEGRIPGTGAK